MSYEKQTWATGDVISAEKLNHIEDGIESAGSGSSAPAFVGTVEITNRGEGNFTGALREEFSDVLDTMRNNIENHIPSLMIFTMLPGDVSAVATCSLVSVGQDNYIIGAEYARVSNGAGSISVDYYFVTITAEGCEVTVTSKTVSAT